jgi:hypothetical protein
VSTVVLHLHANDADWDRFVDDMRKAAESVRRVVRPSDTVTFHIDVDCVEYASGLAFHPVCTGVEVKP